MDLRSSCALSNGDLRGFKKGSVGPLEDRQNMEFESSINLNIVNNQIEELRDDESPSSPPK
jgi:hypothetical protein